MEQKKFIKPSASPYAAPIFFVKKKDGSLRPCVDYRRLNAITLRDRYPIPLISDLIRSLSTAKIFSLMDLRGAYNLLRIKKGDEPKTAFVCKFGQYEFNVMPFGLVNAPSCFQAMMDKLFKDYSNFARPYLDDIIVFSHNEEEHSLHLQQVCQVLKDNKLYAKLNKCHFFKTSLSYLGYIISTTGIHMDSDKVKTISDWPTPRNVKDVQCFLGFANFYRRFIPTYSTFTQPITKLLKKDVPFVWDTNCSTAFTKVKEAFQAETFLAHPNEQLAYIVESDASDFAVGGVLSQMDDKGKMVPIAFHSRGMMPAERNYEIYDKELLAIVVLFQQWRHFLQGGRHKVTVITDHLNLKYFLSTKQLTRRQARWSLFLNEFDFVITHKPGLLHGRADGPSRRPDYNTKTEPQNFKQLLAPHQLQLNAIVSSLPLNIHFDYAKDWPLIIADYLDTGNWIPDLPESLLAYCKGQERYFDYRGATFCRVVGQDFNLVPYCRQSARVGVMQYFHETMGHLKVDSIKDVISRRWWWPDLKQDLKRFINSCPLCQLNSSNTGIYAPRPINPLPPVALPFERWGMDFVGPLPTTNKSNRYIITAIDYATRWVVAAAVKDMTEETVKQFLYTDIMVNYGAPYELLTDRGKYFLSEGIVAFEQEHGISHMATAPYHPQTNGMVERMHAMLGQCLTTLTLDSPKRWDEYLNQTIFALRTRTHAVTKFSPFFLLYGVHPRIDYDEDMLPPASLHYPLDELEEMEANSEFYARTFDDLGQHRAAANTRSINQAKTMRMRGDFQAWQYEPAFNVGDMVKLKHHGAMKFEFRWKGPYHVVDKAFPGTYYLMAPSGQRLDSVVNQDDLAPWLAVTRDNQDFFYDGTVTRTNMQEP
jgi:transposase InsO family protein